MKMQLVSLRDAAEEYPFLTIRRLREMVARRAIPSYRVSGRVYFDRADLEAIPVKIDARSYRAYCQDHRSGSRGLA